LTDWIEAKFRINFRLNNFPKLFGFQDDGTFYQFIKGLLLYVQDF